MSSLLVRPHEGSIALSPADARWTYTGFFAFRLSAGARWSYDSPGRELCVVVLSGGVRAISNGVDLGSARAPGSFFDGPRAAIYAPPGDLELVADAACELAVGTAPAQGGAPARVLRADDVRIEIRGEGAMQRRIDQLLMEDRPADSLLVTEVVTPAGHWSSYPPHKHDVDDPPRESLLEEVYYFRFKDPRGFGLMRVYTAERSLDESLAVRDGDVVLVPRGYHTFSAAPGYDAYYLNVMAGPRREWKITFDPDHERMRW